MANALLSMVAAPDDPPGNALQSYIGPQPRSVVMAGLDRFAPRVHDAIRAGQRALRPAPGANPFNAVAQLVGLSEPGAGIADGPAGAASGPLRRGAQEAAERIVGAAVKLKDGRVAYGPNHGEILDWLGSRGLMDAVSPSNYTGAFVSNTGRYLDAKDAAKMAKLRPSEALESWDIPRYLRESGFVDDLPNALKRSHYEPHEHIISPNSPLFRNPLRRGAQEIGERLAALNRAPSARPGMEPEWISESRRFAKEGTPGFTTHQGGSAREIAAYDNDGKLVGVLSQAVGGPESGALKIAVRDNAQRSGWGSKLLDEAQRIGIDVAGSIEANRFTSEGRALFRNWLSKQRGAQK